MSLKTQIQNALVEIMVSKNMQGAVEHKSEIWFSPKETEHFYDILMSTLCLMDIDRLKNDEEFKRVAANLS